MSIETPLIVRNNHMFSFRKSIQRNISRILPTRICKKECSNKDVPKSKMPYILSPEERKYYEENGFLVIKGLIDFDSLYTYKRRFLQVCNGAVAKGFMVVVKDPSLVAKGLKGEDIINKVSEIHFDDVFINYTENPKLIHVLSQFIGKDMRVTNSMMINKPPGSPQHHPHQDLAYFPFRPAEKIIAAWTAIDDVTAENGGLYVVRGSHKAGVLYDHVSPEGAMKLFHGIVDPKVTEPRVVLEMSPGDTVFFHPLLVHGSGPNVSKMYRKSITAHYASEECHYIQITDGPQAHVARDIEAESRRRGMGMDFADIWRYKSKHVDVIESKL